MKSILTICLTFLTVLGFSQKDPSYYLIDIDPSTIDSSELQLLETSLATFHESKEDSISLQAIAEFIEQSYDPNLWPKYNTWLKAKVEQKLKQQNSPAYATFYEKTLAMCFSNVGFLQMMTGEVDKALIEFKKCIPIYQKHNEPLGMAHTYNNIASVFEMQGRIQEALEYFQKTLEYLRKAGDEGPMGNILNNIAAIYDDNGDTEVALNYYNEAIEYFKKSDDQNSHSITLSNMAIIYGRQQNHEKSLDYHLQGLELLKNFPSDHKGIGTAYYNIGETYFQMNLPDSAINYYDQALVLFKKMQLHRWYR